MTTIQGNLASMARDLEDAQDKSDKLSKKGGKASALKVDAAELCHLGMGISGSFHIRDTSSPGRKTT
jgi:hypothetical protein